MRGYDLAESGAVLGGYIGLAVADIACGLGDCVVSGMDLGWVEDEFLRRRGRDLVMLVFIKLAALATQQLLGGVVRIVTREFAEAVLLVLCDAGNGAHRSRAEGFEILVVN